MFQHLAWAWKAETGTPATKLVLLCLADMANMDRQCWPSQDYIATFCQISERCVRRCLDALEDAALIQREKRTRPDGSNTTDMITLVIGHNEHPDILSAQGRTSMPPGADKMSGLTTLEPTTEPTKESTKGAASRRKPEKPLPEGFPAEREILEAAHRVRQAGVLLDLTREAERFRDYSLANDRRWRDWAAAWRNWISNAMERAPKAATGQPAAATDVSEVRQRAWMQDWIEKPYQWQDHIRGPAPDKPGCRISARIMAEFGHTPPGAEHAPSLFPAPHA